jgi:hypothetical protein
MDQSVFDSQFAASRIAVPLPFRTVTNASHAADAGHLSVPCFRANADLDSPSRAVLGAVDPHSYIDFRYSSPCNDLPANTSVDATRPNLPAKSRRCAITQSDVYDAFSRLYALLGVIWLMNACRFINYRIPLHTLFLALPILRSAILARLVNSVDSNCPAQRSDISLLRFAFYTINLAGLNLACAGFCTYRQRLHDREHIEIFLASGLVTGSLVASHLVSNVRDALLLLGLMCIGIVTYLKQVIISLLMVTHILRQMRTEEQIVAKMCLSRRFVVWTYVIVMVTFETWGISYVIGCGTIVRALIFECGVFVNSCWQLYLFRLNETNCQGGHGHHSGNKVPQKKPLVLVEPLHRLLTIAVQVM